MDFAGEWVGVGAEASVEEWVVPGWDSEAVEARCIVAVDVPWALRTPTIFLVSSAFTWLTGLAKLLVSCFSTQ